MIADDLDRKLLTVLQREIPLESRAFLKIAEQVESSEAEVLRRVRRLKDEEKIIRNHTAAFSGSR